MAKNVKIIPESGSIYFENDGGSIVYLYLDEVTSTLSFLDSSDTALFNVDSNGEIFAKKLFLPATSSDGDFPEGNTPVVLTFDPSTNQVQWQTAATGSLGEDGAIGDKGTKGLKGIKGLKGDQGEASSERGNDGAQGDKSTIKGFKGIKGAKGDQGAPGEASDEGGPKGTQGAKSTVKGEKGIKGAKGDQGEKGAGGIEGDNGESGNIGQKGTGGTAPSGTNNGVITWDSTNAWGNIESNLLYNGTDLTCAGDVIAYYSSDRRLKDNITPLTNVLDKIDEIGGYEFDWNNNQATYEGHDIGVVAQEIESVFPELVQTRDNGYKAVKYEKLTAVLLQAIKELKSEIKELKK